MVIISSEERRKGVFMATGKSFLGTSWGRRGGQRGEEGNFEGELIWRPTKAVLKRKVYTGGEN